MSDISMCVGNDCAIRSTCYRFMAKPDPLYQSYILNEKKIEKEEDCEVFWSEADRNG